MFTRKQVSETKFVVACLTSSYWAFKLSQREFLQIFESDVINYHKRCHYRCQSSHKSLVFFRFDDTA